MNAVYRDNATLLARLREGDTGAEEELLTLNRPLVTAIAARFVGRGCDMEDLVSMGMMGLLRAIRSFDPAKGCVLSTYAVPLIAGEIRRFLRDDGMVKVSRTQKSLAARLLSAKEQLEREGKDTGIASLATVCGVSAEEAASAAFASAPVLSLSEPMGEDGDVTLEGSITDEYEEERRIDRLALAMAMGKLPEQSRKILLLRYYRDYSQEETARALGLSQVKISREEKKILAFLKKELSP